MLRNEKGGIDMEKMRATVFRGVNDIAIEEAPRPHAGFGEAVIRVTLTTICATTSSSANARVVF
jgi:threonine dehydrogenase-like Zn-dependent dehydrogenase